MIKPEVTEKASGYLLLLLTLSLLYMLKSAFHQPRSRPHPCDDALYILIEGDIKRPGAYIFCQQNTLLDLIARAGGRGLHGHPPGLFRDVRLSSGAKVVVRNDGGRWQIFQGEMSSFYKFTLGIPISLNNESEMGLTAIPGIGPQLAKNIIRERSKRGGFKNLNEIKDIKGIGMKLFRNISPYLKL